MNMNFINKIMNKRRKTREIKIGSIKIGNNNPIMVQSMCDTRTKDVGATIEQIHKLEKAGCEIVRVGAPDMESARALGKIKRQIKIPLVADIHFDYKLAIEAIKQGVDKIRINPVNIAEEKIKIIAKEAKAAKIPFRLGINAGSLNSGMIKKAGGAPRAMVATAERAIKILEEQGFNDIIVSLKSSDIFETINANNLFSKKFDYPLHLGITEAGTLNMGLIKSAIGISNLLLKGIGDTIRVSLSENPLQEVLAGHNILRSLNLRGGPMLISCPVCARSVIDVKKISKTLEQKLVGARKPIKIGILGCSVNIQEARSADIGVAGLANNWAILFKKGKIIKKIPKRQIIAEILREIEK